MAETKTRTELAKVIHLVYNPSGTFDVVINKGFAQGIKPGDKFLLFGHGPELKDPETGQSLGVLEVIRGKGSAFHVQENISTIRSIERSRKSGAIKKIVRQSGLSSYLINHGNDTVEETQIEEENLPFKDVSEGDFARPV